MDWQKSCTNSLAETLGAERYNLIKSGRLRISKIAPKGVWDLEMIIFHIILGVIQCEKA